MPVRLGAELGGETRKDGRPCGNEGRGKEEEEGNRVRVQEGKEKWRETDGRTGQIHQKPPIMLSDHEAGFFLSCCL